MGKAKRSDKDHSKIQELHHENMKLKRTISSLRKQLARVDLDRYGTLKDMLDQEEAETGKAQETSQFLKDLKKVWACRECSEGYLEIILYNRRDGLFYFRSCNMCKNRTKSQRYNKDEVKGIMKPEESDNKKKST